MTRKQRENKVKKIASEIQKLYFYHENGNRPEGYGNQELDKATDALYRHLKYCPENKSLTI